MHSKLAVLALAGLAAATPVPQSGTAPDPGQITIIDSTYSGNGCPQGSVSTSTSPDKTVWSPFVNSTHPFQNVSFPISPKPFYPNETRTIFYIRAKMPDVITYGFDQFQTYIGPGTKPADKSKNCALHLNLKYPGGFQYAVVDATYHGFARLDKGVTGTFLTTYFFSQDAGTTSTTRMVANGGPPLDLGQVYTKQDTVETTATVWSPCGTTGILNINNRISLTSTNSSAAGELSNDDATVAFTQQLHVAWRACTPGSVAIS
ncbi:hypothetical protein BDV96DRAFT_600945 [Lophiotrema nucula]|uniref:Uncharacterized protein n=1 Tax=Lophiotrema nucula TaxID=690887 RepID=A0A6A5Z751_9PLEO|nr:hypothetical protein BDV96DRAFT_600945 [Lophiotrema nucula]